MNFKKLRIPGVVIANKESHNYNKHMYYRINLFTNTINIIKELSPANFFH